MTIDLESWQAIAAAIALLVVTVHSKLESRKTKHAAEKAVELSKPTGNGFARDVKESLKRIEEAQARTEKKIDDHITAHANADVANRPRPRRILRDVNEL